MSNQNKNQKSKIEITIIIVAVSIKNGRLMVLIPEGKLPQETYRRSQQFDALVRAVIKKSSGIALSRAYIEQLYTFDDAEVIVSYLALIPRSVSVKESQKNWIPVNKLKQLSAVEQDIIAYAQKRLQYKLEYTNVAYSLLPELFTLSQLQKVYEIILGKRLDKRNFRKKILSLKLLVNTGEKRRSSGHRPAALYRFRTRRPMIVEIL